MNRDLYYLSQAQLERIQPYFPLSRGVSRVDDRKVLSGIIYVIKTAFNGRMPSVCTAPTKLFTIDSSGGAEWESSIKSSWSFAKGSDFSADHVMTALSSFNRLINPSHKKVFSGIFTTLETGLSKLGDTAGARAKAFET